MDAPTPDANPQLPSFDVNKRVFHNPHEVQAYLERSAWSPIPAKYGVPLDDGERLKYVKMIYDSIIDLSSPIGRNLWPGHDLEFHAGIGLWTNPADIEATSEFVVWSAQRIHNYGAVGSQIAAILQSTPLHPLDELCTFPQRLFLMSILLRHSKFCADQVMRQFCIEQYLVRIWSTLMEQTLFTLEWNEMSQAQQHWFLTVKPYTESGVIPPSNAEWSSWKAELNQRANTVLQHQQSSMMERDENIDVSVERTAAAGEQTEGFVDGEANINREASINQGQHPLAHILNLEIRPSREISRQ